MHHKTKRQEKVSCLFGSSRPFSGDTPGYLWCTSLLQAMFTQPTPVLSLGSDLRSWSLSSQPPPTPAVEQRSLSGWWVLAGTDPLCRNLSALPSAPCCCTLLCGSKASPLCYPQSPPVKGASECVETFPPSQLPPTGAGPVPILLSLFFLFSFALSRYMGRVSCLLIGLSSSASSQYVFCRSCSTCRCISDVLVGRKVISTSYSSAILKLLLIISC